MPLITLPIKSQRESSICINLKLVRSKKALSPFLFPYSLNGLVRCAGQPKMSVTWQKCVMANPVLALRIDSKSMAYPAKMGGATASWGCALRCRGSARSCGDQVGIQAPCCWQSCLSMHTQRKTVLFQVNRLINRSQNSILSILLP